MRADCFFFSRPGNWGGEGGGGIFDQGVGKLGEMEFLIKVLESWGKCNFDQGLGKFGENVIFDQGLGKFGENVIFDQGLWKFGGNWIFDQGIGKFGEM